ncbi:hypothetical protein [Granulicella mallensis]|uniref:Uncharacterized protein n=1 Tax=Granulicella mallensis (strain ATCC BAA-1857 / DSM 23137 / MP5ACTX8) TaxID=682795 RepID=G8NRB0_GRAMM|nr:hypothetical protein [Granulicella mallensis]AEU36188.1 hypothetical protein AciX8_1852 [Granulicella mallensis MP5ACTX8]
MPPQITLRDLDGMPKGEIHLAIANSERQTLGLMEQKLNEHREKIERRLDNQDEKLETMQQDITSLVGTDKVPGQIGRNTELLEGLVAKHEAWHEQDTEFRSHITSQVSELKEQHKSVTKDIRSVKWFITICSALGMAGNAILKVVRQGKELYKAIGVGGILWILIVQFLHLIWPLLHAWLHW